MSAPFFDTNIITHWLRRRPQAYAEIQRYSSHRISRIVWTEVLAGERLEDRRAVQEALSNFEMLEIDQEIAARAASMRRERERLKAMDAIILSTAQIRGRVLVTRNTKDFPAEMPGIRVPYQL